MHIRKLNIINFKNHEQREFAFSKKINCFVGRNGVGKTNILDALYYLSFSKSFVNITDSQNIRNDEEFFSLRGVYDVNGIDETILLNFHRQKGKSMKRNDKEYEKISDHIGLLPLVIISPQDIKLIFDGSAERRKFLDSAISQFNNSHLVALQNYNRALLQRNKILKSGFVDHILLEMWDEHLIKNGKILYENRRDFIRDFLPEFQKYYSLISINNEVPTLTYQSQMQENTIENLLKESLSKDLVLQHTSCGSHKDDLVFEVSGMSLKNSGSQGQQKTFLTALKLAQYSFLGRVGKRPILLLDDIFDKLDPHRVNAIVNMVLNDDTFGQIFITHTSPVDLERMLKSVTDDFEMFEI
ncbi:MAG: DNA replication and repair protein RecF [Bacteroidales bacterium]|nr:DNA replication and repair protein RecF [Bacteroidales bacterium]